MDIANKKPEVEEGEVQIDLLRLVGALWHRAWIIALAAILFGGAAFVWAKFMITPLYETSALVYVNNSAVSTDSTTSITPNELTAAKSLVETYIVILQAESTMEELASVADLDRDPEELSKMITASAVNETEIFKITATSPDPEEAALIIDTLTGILPNRISSVVDGSSVRIVDNSGVADEKVYPNVTRYTLIGFLLGFLLACAFVVVMELLDDVIHGEEFLSQNYDAPVLAVVPDLSENETGGYSYYEGYDKSHSGEDKHEADKNKKH